jgi:O-antigen/teichoic acid export membrane protein
MWALIHGTARYIDFAHMMQHDFRGVFLSKLLFGATFLGLIICAWWYWGQIELFWLVIMQAIAGVPSLLAYAWYRRDYLRWGRYSANWARRIFHFGKFVLGTNISSMLFNKMDLMMVGFFLNPAAVAIYNVATRITNYLEVPMSGIAQVIYPRLAMANQEAGTKEVTQLYEKAVGLIVALVLPMVAVVLCFAEPIVVLIAGQQYASAAPLLTILVLAVMIKPWGRLFGITLDAIGRPKMNFMLLLAGLVVNIGLNALFLYWWGLRGAAFATLLSMTLMIVTGQALITRLLPISQSNILRQVWSFYRQPRQVLQLK